MELQEEPNLKKECITKVAVKVPKRVLHFSDGVLEEYSDDEVDNTVEPEKKEEPVDPKTMTWPQWFAYKAWTAGTTTLGAVDYVGEGLAEFFGITTPKFQYEINEFHRLEEEKKKIEEDAKGWVAKETETLKTTQPEAALV